MRFFKSLAGPAQGGHGLPGGEAEEPRLARAISLVGENPEQLVELVGAGVRRSGRWLVEAIDMGVAAGEIVALIGPNGSGKSTTARMTAGILHPDRGRVQRAAGHHVGYVPQKMPIDRTLPLTVARLMRLTASPRRDVVEAALADVGLAHLAGAEVHTLSGGEFQRVLLARAILGRPRLLVLDEPLQGVDRAGAAALYRLIASVRDRIGCGVLLVSHDLESVMATADTVICLDQGHVRCRGTPREVAASPGYRALFGSLPTDAPAAQARPDGGSDDRKVRHA